MNVQFSHSVMSDSLRLHELQHARPPCLSPTLGVYPNPCPSSWWCHPAISSSVVPFSRGSSQPRNRTGVSCVAGRFFTNWAMRVALLEVRCLIFDSPLYGLVWQGCISVKSLWKKICMVQDPESRTWGHSSWVIKASLCAGVLLWKSHRCQYGHYHRE